MFATRLRLALPLRALSAARGLPWVLGGRCRLFSNHSNNNNDNDKRDDGVRAEILALTARVAQFGIAKKRVAKDARAEKGRGDMKDVMADVKRVRGEANKLVQALHSYPHEQPQEEPGEQGGHESAIESLYRDAIDALIVAECGDEAFELVKHFNALRDDFNAKKKTLAMAMDRSEDESGDGGGADAAAELDDVDEAKRQELVKMMISVESGELWLRKQQQLKDQRRSLLDDGDAQSSSSSAAAAAAADGAGAGIDDGELPVSVYEGIMNVWSRDPERTLQEMFEVYSELLKRKLRPTQVMFNALLRTVSVRVATGRDSPGNAFERLLYMEMDREGAQVDTDTMNVYISVVSSMGMPDKVYSFYQKLAQRSLLPNEETYELVCESFSSALHTLNQSAFLYPPVVNGNIINNSDNDNTVSTARHRTGLPAQPLMPVRPYNSIMHAGRPTAAAHPPPATSQATGLNNNPVRRTTPGTDVISNHASVSSSLSSSSSSSSSSNSTATTNNVPPDAVHKKRYMSELAALQYDILQLFHDMVRRQHSVLCVYELTLRALISRARTPGYSPAVHLGAMMEVYHDMLKQGLFPSATLCQEMLDALAEHPSTDTHRWQVHMYEDMSSRKMPLF